jgi:chromosomal replication initiation ATPase DnaA
VTPQSPSPPTGDLDPAESELALANTWQRALAQLRGQMDPQTFDCWLGSSRLVDASNGVWTVAVVSAGARDWLRHRLAPTIADTVSRLASHDVTLGLVVADDGQRAPAPWPASEMAGPTTIRSAAAIARSQVSGAVACTWSTA